jgi:uncharacterized protein (DUF302 family)
MTGFTLSRTLSVPYAEAVAQVRDGLADQGFGVLTEIDLAATLKAKLDVDIAPEVILGACRPPLAYAALQVDPSIAAVLPCNVVVRSVDATTTVVEAFDPAAMMALADNPALDDVATDAGQRIGAMLDALGPLAPLDATDESTPARRT